MGNLWDGYGTILRSTDSGNTWARQGSTNASHPDYIAGVNMAGVVAVDPFTAWVVGFSDDGYATIYHTTDGGSTWTRKGSAADVPDVDLVKVTAYGDSKVWGVGTKWGLTNTSAIMHTSDGGATWTNQIPAGYEDIALQGVSTPDGTTVWVTGSEPKDGYALILKSTDAGQTWTRQSGGQVTDVDHVLGVSAADADTAWAVGGATPAAGDDYFAMHTTNGGATWTRQVGVKGWRDANEVCAVSTAVVWAACDHGVFWSTDGGLNWDNKTTGPYTMGISAVNSQEAWAVRSGYDGSIYHTADGGSTWTALNELGGEELPSLGTVSFSTQPINMWQELM
ncbi:MAG: hypothetical protein ABH852_00600 [Methanobacteriota archaeon]